ncbi:SUMF1/EgtB/PvdO family nonheme iron enzyme [Stenomitos frigidus]|nr:SUMF1/EgtB/PvdO family nonheme iron enzyme [Stenomitos frigidus]
MPSKESIFISYRRTDSQDVVGRIDDYLSRHFGREHVFLDRNSIGYGDAFPNRLKQAVQVSKVVLVVMGSTWLSVKDNWGRSRLASPNDWVRQEIALALKQGLYVIPILLDGTVMPGPAQLPQDIQALAKLNAINLITRQSANVFTTLMKEITDSIERKVPALKPIPLEPFEFETARLVIVKKPGLFGGKTTVEISRSRSRAEYFAEDLGNGVTLDMVAVPGDEFLMGTSASQREATLQEYLKTISKENAETLTSLELPQHKVVVPAFRMGKYPVTQAQYEAIVGTNPSNFKGAKRPVEQVSWDDAIAFCTQLSQKTGKTYRLPSEAEWEYACRAGTTTPFYFGETMTPDLANYDGTNTYGEGPKGTNRKQTTDVGSFPANAFGLYDMHGNVWEWCADPWHGNYNGAPTDGSAWTTNGNSERRLIRGGSWFGSPVYCRAAARSSLAPAVRNFAVGFRVVCSVFPGLS